MPVSARLRSLVALLALAVIVLGVALTGRSYATCLATGAIHTTACCAQVVHGDEPAVDDAPCCEDHAFGAVPAARADTSAIDLADVAQAAVLPPSLPALERATSTCSLAARHACRPTRAGPEPPPLRVRLSRLSVLRC